MIGLMMLLALGLYLAISAGVVAWTVRWAKRNGRGVWRWGIAAGFLMYLLVFWDHIPTLVLHKHYCATKAGFWVYKTPEQWKAENPGVAETLTWRESSPQYNSPDGSFGYRLNERFIYEIRREQTPMLPVRISTYSILDINKSVVVKQVSVGCGYDSFYKFWVRAETCMPGQKQLDAFRKQFKELGREVK